MATPVWNEKKQQWILETMSDRKRKAFTSSDPSKKGLVDVRKKYNNWVAGESEKADWRIDKCYPLFLDDVRARSSEDNYIYCERLLRLYILPKCHLRKIGSMTVNDWQHIINTAKPAGRKTKKGTEYPVKDALSKKMLSNIRGVIVSFCVYMSKYNMPALVPHGLYVPVSAPTIEKGILQPDQLKTLFKASTAWYVNAWRFMVVTGLRPGETYGIQRNDIKDGLLTISRAVNERGIETKGKNENAKRELLLNAVALSIIEDQIAIINKKGLVGKWIFPNRYGEMPMPGNVYKRWKIYAKSNNITVSPYCLRHTWISIMKNKMPAEMVKMLVGHSESMDTFGVYGHKIEGELQESKTIMDNVFANLI